jgi:hypothetical protein
MKLDEAETKIEALREKATHFARAVVGASMAVSRDHLHCNPEGREVALKAINEAIAEWNGLINLAPGTLEKVKLKLLGQDTTSIEEFRAVVARNDFPKHQGKS